MCRIYMFVLCEIPVREPFKVNCRHYCTLEIHKLLATGDFACENCRKRGRKLNGNEENHLLLDTFDVCKDVMFAQLQTAGEKAPFGV